MLRFTLKDENLSSSVGFTPIEYATGLIGKIVFSFYLRVQDANEALEAILMLISAIERSNPHSDLEDVSVSALIDIRNENGTRRVIVIEPDQDCVVVSVDGRRCSFESVHDRANALEGAVWYRT